MTIESLIQFAVVITGTLAVLCGLLYISHWLFGKIIIYLGMWNDVIRIMNIYMAEKRKKEGKS